LSVVFGTSTGFSKNISGTNASLSHVKKTDAASQNIFAYKIGDVVTQDIIAPFELTALDSQATESARGQEAKTVPAVFRFDPNAADEAEAEFRSAFNAARANFQKRLDASFLLESLFHDRKLDTNELASERFARVINSFRNENESFPLTKNLADLWATGGSDAALQNALAGRLRAVMRHYILKNAVASDEFPETRPALLISVTNEAEMISPDSVTRRGKAVSVDEFFSLEKARDELREKFSAKEESAADFLASFVKGNCIYEADLTHEISERKTEKIWMAAHYEPGEIIAKRGEVVTAKIKAALDQIASNRAFARLRTNAESISAKGSFANHFIQLCILALGFAVLLGFVLWRIRRRKFSEKFVSSTQAGKEISPRALNSVVEVLVTDEPTAMVSTEADVKFWRERALDAELRLEKAGAAVQSRLLPHLVRMLMDKFVQKVVSQRTELLDAQRLATLKVAQLEKCLEKIHAPAEDQLKAYQLRIEQLEKELAAKGEENRELMRATIRLTEAQMKVREETKSRADWN
jgi:hypothetical protein